MSVDPGGPESCLPDPGLLLKLAGKVRLALSDLQALQVLLGQVVAEAVLLLQETVQTGQPSPA